MNLDELLDEIYLGQERVSASEIQRRALAVDLPVELLTRVDAMPEGLYAQEEAAEVLQIGVVR